MITRTLISNTGERRTLSIKTGWEDMTVSEYIAMQGKPETEVLTMLTGLDAETLAALDTTTALFLSDLLQGFQELPEEDFSLNIERETIGQYETAKGFIKRLAKDKPDSYQLEILPVLYGLYAAEKKKGKWHNKTCMQLAERAKLMPVSEVGPFALHVLAEINRVVEKEKAMAEEDEPDPDMEEAGAADLGRFGFYPALNALTGGDILKQEEVLQLSVLKVHTHLNYLRTAAEVQKNLQELKKQAA